MSSSNCRAILRKVGSSRCTNSSVTIIGTCRIPSHISQVQSSIGDEASNVISTILSERNRRDQETHDTLAANYNSICRLHPNDTVYNLGLPYPPVLLNNSLCYSLLYIKRYLVNLFCQESIFFMVSRTANGLFEMLCNLPNLTQKSVAVFH